MHRIFAFVHPVICTTFPIQGVGNMEVSVAVAAKATQVRSGQIWVLLGLWMEQSEAPKVLYQQGSLWPGPWKVANREKESKSLALKREKYMQRLRGWVGLDVWTGLVCREQRGL